ncbi:hypothetical protein F5Y15DRAFT_6761 [Xylariaceae sp. FL0016]|nr:hypothetical protein F5Y15DRAFT_6761 [Xylariaceae sp. FL0016]
MLASAETVAPPAPSGLYFDPLHDRPPSSKPSQTSFKKHKVLPHPRTGRPASIAVGNTRPSSRSLSFDPTAPFKLDTRPSTPSRLKNVQNITTVRPDLPPTPPAHSRTSSSSHSIHPSTPTYVASPVQSDLAVSDISRPGTPSHQRSPPTPDVTPPRPGRRQKAFRPILADRIPSKATTVDSRTESFKTAREDPDSTDEDEKTTPKPYLSSSKGSQSTVRRLLDARPKKAAADVGLGLGLDSEDNLTPRTKQEFFVFDGEWASASEVEQEWDDNLERNVIVRKRRTQSKLDGRKQQKEVIEDVTVTPTNATKALRSLPLHDRIQTQPSPSPLEFTIQGNRPHWVTTTAPSTSESSLSTDVRRSSGMSSKSTVSTVVEAILVDAPPQRQKTLRHVRKITALRDSNSEVSLPSSTTNSVRYGSTDLRSRALGRNDSARTDSLASTGTVNSIASRKARREVWKNGGIPVVVVPDRRASIKSTAPSSLRSTSSRRSKRSNSIRSVPVSNTRMKELAAGEVAPRGTSMSISDGSLPGDQRTLDYPPIVPMRTSSLSASTSRNTSRTASRAGSLTTESLKAHNALLEQELQKKLPQVTVEHAPPAEDTSSHPDQKQLQLTSSVESQQDELFHNKSLVDQNGDPFFGKRLTVHTTPFSQASVETSGTHSAADIAEALAVNIYPHQNKSVLMVHHMSKPIEPANAVEKEILAQADGATDTAGTGQQVLGNPQITANGPNSGPVTPPQTIKLSMDDVDSPLRNPRAPPAPPAIKFIPATPSGLTPTSEKEKMLGNYFEDMGKKPSLVRRAFSLRKNSDNTTSRTSGFLARTLSLSKNIRRDTAENPALERDSNAILHQYPTADEPPTDEDKLHPFWQPAHQLNMDDDFVYDMPEEVDRVYRYPPIDNRPAPPRRSLSERMKRTFAILPVEDDNHYARSDHPGPERRTIKRTPSGSLRVMRHHESYSSIRRNSLFLREQQREPEGRPSTAPERSNSLSSYGRRVWGIEKKVDERGRRLFPGWQEKLSLYQPQNLKRRLSEHRRQKRTEALRRTISGPREVRDGVGEVIKRNSYKGPSYQTSSGLHAQLVDADAIYVQQQQQSNVRHAEDSRL